MEKEMRERTEEQPKVEKTGFLSRENLYSHINVSLRTMDCFIAVLVVLLIAAVAVGVMR